jgi:hypothetical protein
MLTARRLHERREAEAAGLPPPAPALPDLIPRGEHERLVNELRTAHGQELAAARARVKDLERETAGLRGRLESHAKATSSEATEPSPATPASEATPVDTKANDESKAKKKK